ncbi:hypothetical protein HMPREF0454_01237 [Hafnia alvei ATCC 51873]|uniref:Uncharacterized protein n=1 Tax=Hafnia alvei ATCC 51873 TaxID=1002364 RepID=G9Y3V7_HAFAL|nr:hypothetical protein HMPREF0454_01237 [Hafnia alvei ATCC 51873]
MNDWKKPWIIPRLFCFLPQDDKKIFYPAGYKDLNRAVLLNFIF